jgi:hypothetical protein
MAIMLILFRKIPSADAVCAAAETTLWGYNTFGPASPWRGRRDENRKAVRTIRRWHGIGGLIPGGSNP